MASTPPPDPDFSSPSGRSRPPAFANPAQAVRWARPYLERRVHHPLSAEASDELADRLESGYDTLSAEHRTDEYSAFVGHYVDRLTSRMSTSPDWANPARSHGDGGGYGDGGAGEVGPASDPIVRSMRAICPMWPFC